MSLKQLKQLYQKIISYVRKSQKKWSIQITISVSFTLISICSMGILTMTLFERSVNMMEENAIASSEQVLNQTAINLENYLRNMRRISDVMFYSVIKDKDLSKESINSEMDLIYEANRDSLISVACYTRDGELVAASPLVTEKANLRIQDQQWFEQALDKMENFHFSTPHVQNLFDNANYGYYWVISLSRAVQLTFDGQSVLGVLLVDMNYNSIEQIFAKANLDNSSEYIYLMDGDGELIYHPKQKLIYTNLYDENNLATADYDDGIHRELFNGEERLVTVKTISYTGWKVVSVVPKSSLRMSFADTQLFFVIFASVLMLATVILNLLISANIAKPLRRLNDSVKAWEAGNMNPDIYIGGSMEVEHLGKTLRSAVAQLRQLMDDIVYEQEEKRKSELDALQSQINPHFLYNTLDSIVWMIEGEKYDDAVFMITQLASLFRISLSKGRTIISIQDEIKHAQNYMNIQQVRYKNVFCITFDIDEEILSFCTVKLIIQPLLENAIYYGVECMDGDGEIVVKGYAKENDIYIEVKDNGMGMPEETVKQLLTENQRVRKHGSGVGLINVHNRIQLRFGKEYGLEIESELDEGTTVRIHLPAIPYDAENVKRMESGEYRPLKGDTHDEEK